MLLTRSRLSIKQRDTLAAALDAQLTHEKNERDKERLKEKKSFDNYRFLQDALSLPASLTDHGEPKTKKNLNDHAMSATSR